MSYYKDIQRFTFAVHLCTYCYEKKD